ncbi:hypothetical protein Kfla_2082 [Kribbella flavida DSM 17836]|uniref:Uncharacterized protein n=1 Tax=Kribbella flavida (strain DSM 17836 / JCM 10339 / NBRC 14399) TaxID=479435 RepID=D2PS40_KRIFD|nr:hypothetical protein [Kribbella flavida]ADB31164.1 hypothetical protein Kfla_2082 [Kribbella flavida DSM 17836]
MTHPYLTPNGAPSVREITLHYVTVCLHLEKMDDFLANLPSALNSVTGPRMEANLVNATLDLNDKAWDRRTKLAAERTTAYDALFTECGGDQSRIDACVSTVAKEFGIVLEPTQ